MKHINIPQILRAKKLKYLKMLNCRFLKLKSTNPQEFWSILNRLSSTKPESSIDLYALYEHFQQLGRFSENQIVVDLYHIDMDANIDDLCELNRNFTKEEITNCVRKMKNG